jgi:predicted ester cyclase
MRCRVWRWILRGTTTGAMLGRPATGKRIDLRGCEFNDADGGKVLRVASYFDRPAMLMGVVPTTT